MQHKIRQFGWTKKVQADGHAVWTAVEESSTLGWRVGVVPTHFDVQSTTGRVCRFVHAFDISNKGEVEAFIYKLSTGDALRYPHLKHAEIHVLND